MPVAASEVTRQRRADGTPIVYASGSGATVLDREGRDYLDFICGFGPVVIGHADPDWSSRVLELMGGGIHLPGYTSAHDDFAQAVCDAGRWSVGYFKHSSDAVTAAVRLAGMETGRRSFIRCGYLGWHDALIASSPRWHEPLSSPARAEVRYHEGFRGVHGAERPADWVGLDPVELREIVRTAPDAYACLAVDAYQATLLDGGWLQAGMELCREHGIRIIIDETKTSGRVSPLGALVDLHEQADYVVLGKAIANGAPLSLLLGPPSMISAYGGARVSGTFSKELLALWAATATAERMSKNDGYALLRGAGRTVAAAFEEATEQAETAGRVRAVPLFDGAMWEVAWAPSMLGDLAARARLPEHMASAGVLILQGHPSFVSLAHADMDADVLVERFRAGLEAWKREEMSR
ncbi:aminotransferase class III-fold pyridoxal phosphate-dependent enzyme [Nonomuraea sp. NPDC050691]|uniref:aminotransferase class III-fold pyridoxal phosphate-dependent enzyme n=1 Tax=Nonomuraea sp. NPDC050691 TaxID=3155661 RepID=UPI0033C03D9C